MRTHALAITLATLCLAWIPLDAVAHDGDVPLQEQGLTAEARRQIAALRAATAAYHDFDAATQPGLWTEPAPPHCMDDAAGAMGHHFLRPEYVGSLDPAQPQVLIYEPELSGDMRLVAVEYIAGGLPGDTPPTLFGQAFIYNDTFDVWTLHAWVWRHNPMGLFAQWNPVVSCRYAL